MPEELITKLTEIERRLRWGAVLELCVRGLSLGLAAGIVLSLVGSNLGPAPGRILTTTTVIAMFLPAVGAAAYGAMRRHSLMRVARICDRRLGLKERISTALEVAMMGARGPMLDAQLQDALRSLDAIDLKRAFSPRFPVRSSIIAVVMLGVLTSTLTRPHPLSAVLADAGVVLPTVATLTSGQAGAASLLAADDMAGDADRLNGIEARTHELAHDIGQGEAPRDEIVDRLYREEFALRPLLNRPSSDQRGPALRLSNRLRSLRRAAELSEGVRQRDYPEVIRQIHALAGRLTTASDEERSLTSQILARASRDEIAIFPEIAPILERASAASALLDRNELVASLEALQTALRLGDEHQSTSPPPLTFQEETPLRP